MRTCTACGEEKLLIDFPKNGKDKEGMTRYRNDCKTCYNVTRKLTKQKAVTKFLNNTKKRTGEVGTYTRVDWRDVMVHFKGCCAYCWKGQTRSSRLTRDHVVPVKNGGDTSRKNIVPACKTCNSSKGDLDWAEWLKTRKYYKPTVEQRIREWVE